MKLGKTHERFHGVACGILQASPVCMGLKNPIVPEVTPWSRVSPPSFNDLQANGPRGCNLKPSSRGVARLVRPGGVTACSRRSPPCKSSCCRCCTAIPPALLCPLCQACGSVRRPPVKLAPHARHVSSPSASNVSEAWCRPAPRAKAGGRATARLWSMARDAPCPILRPYRTPSASRRRNGLGAAFPSPGSWGCSLPAPVCSSSWWSRPSSPTISPRCRRCIRPYTQGTGSWPIGACVPTRISPASSRLACMPCGAADACRQRSPTIALAHRFGTPRPTRGVVAPEDSSRMARPGDVGGLARGFHAPRGARPDRHAGLPDPRDHPGDHAPGRSDLPCRRSRRTVPPALAGRNLSRAAQDHEADGRVARPNRARCPEGIAPLCYRLQPGSHGHVALCHASTHQNGADQLPRCAAVARRPEPRDPVRSVARHPHSTASRGTPRQETAAEELPLHGQTPARAASAIGTASAQRLTSCHSRKTPILARAPYRCAVGVRAETLGPVG
jgi:hypothetical protein